MPYHRFLRELIPYELWRKIGNVVLEVNIPEYLNDLQRTWGMLILLQHSKLGILLNWQFLVFLDRFSSHSKTKLDSAKLMVNKIKE